MSAQDELKDVISNGIALDIFNAEEAFALEEFIGINADAINKATFGAFFGDLQLILNRQLILSLARIYEAPNNRYSIRSIPVGLKILEENAGTLPIPERPTLIKDLKKLGLDASMLNPMTDQELTIEVVNYLKGKIPRPIENGSLLDRALHATQTLRNKNVAHPESIAWSDLPKPKYSELKTLIDIAKDFVSLVGLPYLSIGYQCDAGDYLLSSDATRSLRCLKRIFEKLEIEVKND